MHVPARQQFGPIVWSRNCICWSFFCPPQDFVRSERLCNAQQKKYGVLRRQIIGRVGGRKNKTRWIRQLGNNWWVTQCIYKVHSMPQQLEFKTRLHWSIKVLCVCWDLRKLAFAFFPVEICEIVFVGVFFFFEGRKTKNPFVCISCPPIGWMQIAKKCSFSSALGIGGRLY